MALAKSTFLGFVGYGWLALRGGLALGGVGLVGLREFDLEFSDEHRKWVALHIIGLEFGREGEEARQEVLDGVVLSLAVHERDSLDVDLQFLEFLLQLAQFLRGIVGEHAEALLEEFCLRKVFS